MAVRTGTASLPLHGGRCPPWLFDRMRQLGAAIVEAMVESFGPDEVLRRLADPFWFQALGCVLGYDWHSSGVTTVVCGALKEGLKGHFHRLGIYVCGGKGGTSRRTPEEIRQHVEAAGLSVDPEHLAYASRMAAKVDGTAVQDGHVLYHHTFFFTRSGAWCVVQQGMNEATGRARRYHWLGEEVRSFVEEPHAAVLGQRQPRVELNMVARESAPAREACTALAGEPPRRVLELVMPDGHPIPGRDRLEKALQALYERQPRNFEQVLATPGVGPKTVRALAMVAEVVFGARPSFRDPARYAFAHGGKDGIPFPVDRELYDRTISTWKQAVRRARLGRRETLEALRKLAELERQGE